MQSEAAGRAGDSSGEGEEPPPEGLGGHHLHPDRSALSNGPGRHHLYRQQAALAAKRPDGMWFSPTPYFRSRMAFSTSAWRRWSASSWVSPSRSVMKPSVGGEEGQLGTGSGLHPGNEPHRCGVGLTLEGGVGGLGHIGGAVHPVWDGRPVRLGYGLDQVPQASRSRSGTPPRSPSGGLGPAPCSRAPARGSRPAAAYAPVRWPRLLEMYSLAAVRNRPVKRCATRTSPVSLLPPALTILATCASTSLSFGCSMSPG